GEPRRRVRRLQPGAADEHASVLQRLGVERPSRPVCSALFGVGIVAPGEIGRGLVDQDRVVHGPSLSVSASAKTVARCHDAPPGAISTPPAESFVPPAPPYRARNRYSSASPGNWPLRTSLA